MKDNDFYNEEDEKKESSDSGEPDYESRIIRQLLKEVAAKPLLTREEEVSFAQQIEQGKEQIIGILAENISWGKIAPQLQDCIEQHATKARKNAREAISTLIDFWQGKEGEEGEILKIPLILLEGIAEEKSIPQAILLYQTTRGIINEMVERNMLLVVHVAKKWQWQNGFLAIDDLIQEGNTGLMKAVEKFNWRKGCKFCTFAIWWIDQAIRRTIENESRTIKIPAYLQGPDAKEIFPAPISIEAPIWDWDSGEQLTLKDMLADKGKPVEEEAESKIRREVLEKILSQLPKRYAQVVKMRIGLGTNCHPLTFQMISKMMKISKERVRQIQEEAFQKLRRPKESQLLRELL